MSLQEDNMYFLKQLRDILIGANIVYLLDIIQLDITIFFILYFIYYNIVQLDVNYIAL